MSSSFVVMISTIMVIIFSVFISTAEARLIESKTLYEIPAIIESDIPLIAYGATVEPDHMVPGADSREKFVPAGTPLTAIAFYSSENKSIIWSKVHFHPPACGDSWYNPIVCGIPSDIDIKHNIGVMTEKNQKVPGYFTKGDENMARRVMKNIDVLRDRDEFMFRFDATKDPSMLRFTYKKHSTGKWEQQDEFPFGKENFDHFTHVLLERYVPDNKQLAAKVVRLSKHIFPSFLSDILERRTNNGSNSNTSPAVSLHKFLNYASRRIPIKHRLPQHPPSTPPPPPPPPHLPPHPSSPPPRDVSHPSPVHHLPPRDNNRPRPLPIHHHRSPPSRDNNAAHPPSSPPLKDNKVHPVPQHPPIQPRSAPIPFVGHHQRKRPGEGKNH